MIEINGVKLTLGIQGLAKWEEVTGKTIMSGDFQQPTIKEIAAFIYAAMEIHDETASMEKAYKFIESIGLKSAGEIVLSLINKAFGGASNSENFHQEKKKKKDKK